MGRPRTDPKIRFASYCKEEDGCTIWTGGIGTFGHAIFTLDSDRRGIPASLAAWLMYVGEVPPGMKVKRVACGNKLCVKVEHLGLESSSGGRPRNLTANEKKRVADLRAAGKTLAEVVSETGIPSYSVHAELNSGS